MKRYEAAFLVAVNTILRHEGGFNNVKGDSGGATNYGISLRLLKDLDIDINDDGDINIHDIRSLTQDEAIDIYHREWWEKHSYGSMDSRVATKVMDMAVNMGAKQAHKLLQAALCKLGRNVLCDGVLGPKTRAYINDVNALELVEQLRMECVGFYKMLVVKRPEYEKFLKGWLNRAKT